MLFRDNALAVVLPAVLTGYVFLFMAQEQHASVAKQDLSPTLPTSVLAVLGHSYMRQLIAESLFIKTAVYYGGLDKRMSEKNLDIMGRHFLSMSRLHPKILDIYYRVESALADRGETHVGTANTVLERGRTALPDAVPPPFFEGFNYFHYLQQPTKAAEILREAAAIPDAPRWLGHLASVLMAKGGNIRTSLVWLKGMYATAEEEYEKKRYTKEIAVFEQAMQVQLALERYARRVGRYPAYLTDLLPHDLKSLPVWKNGYYLEYKPPRLFLSKRRVQHKGHLGAASHS